MKFLSLLLLVCLNSLPAGAVDFSGNWSGAGTVTQKDPFTGAHSSPCEKITVTLEHLPASLTIRRYHAVCGALDSDWGPSVMKIQGTDIFEDGEKTGSLLDNTLLTLAANGGVEYAFNLRLKPATESALATLESYYGVRNMAGTIVIEGVLNPANAIP